MSRLRRRKPRVSLWVVIARVESWLPLPMAWLCRIAMDIYRYGMDCGVIRVTVTKDRRIKIVDKYYKYDPHYD